MPHETRLRQPIAGRERPDIRAGIRKRIATVAIVFLLVAATLFLAAGRLDWTWAWIYLAIGLATVLINGAIILRTHPETVAERGELHFERKWDKAVSGLYALSQFLAVPLVAGLDARLGWTRGLGLAWHVAGAVALAAAYGLAAWAMMANAYFSTAVRVQSERGHAVCDTGPYRLVRHPGYAGFILQALGTPCLLGSCWALAPGIAAAASMVVRTSLEDRTLRAELSGYADYARKVRYRLLPGIW